MIQQVDHLIMVARLANDLLPRATPEGKEMSRRLELAIEEVIRAKAKKDYLESNAIRGIPSRR